MPKAKQPDYERIGKDFEDIVVKNYFELYNTRHQIWMSFIKGVFAGLGGALGATIVLAAVVFLLHKLGGVPVIGQYLNHASQTIQRHEK